MTRLRIATAMALAVALVAPVAGCSSGGSGGVTNIEDVQDATIFISAFGIEEKPSGT